MSDVKKLIGNADELVCAISAINNNLENYTNYLIAILKDQSPEPPEEIVRCLLGDIDADMAKKLGYSIDNEARDLCLKAQGILYKRLETLTRQLEENVANIRLTAEKNFEKVFGSVEGENY